MASADLGAPGFDPDAVRRTAADVLARPEYREAAPSLVDRALEWVLERLGLLLEAFGAGSGPIWGAVLLLGVVLVVVLLAVRFARTVRGGAALPAGIPGRVGRSPRDWDREAEEHAAAGRWRDAVRCRYRSAVAELAARGVVEEVPGRTAGEYLVAVARDAPAAAAAFADATRRFEAVWYGDERADAGTVAALLEDRAAVLAVLRASVPEAVTPMAAAAPP